LGKNFNRLPSPPASRRVSPFSKTAIAHALRVLAPTLFALTFASVAHAQGTMDFSGAQTLMGTFNARFAYVSVSRASNEAQIYTNDARSLGKDLSRDVTKTSAVDFANPHHNAIRQGFDKGAGSSKMPDLNMEIPL
jgi:hypothetical protein